MSAPRELEIWGTALYSVKASQGDKGQSHCCMPSPEATGGFGARPVTLWKHLWFRGKYLQKISTEKNSLLLHNRCSCRWHYCFSTSLLQLPRTNWENEQKWKMSAFVILHFLSNTALFPLWQHSVRALFWSWTSVPLSEKEKKKTTERRGRSGKEKNTANSKCFESSYPILLGTKCQWAE